MVVILWELDLQPYMQSVPITKRGVLDTTLCIGYRTFKKKKELSFIESGRLIFAHEYTGEGRDAEGLYLSTSAEKEAFHIL